MKYKHLKMVKWNLQNLIILQSVGSYCNPVGVGKNSIKPIAKTESCQSPSHTQYIISGKVKVVLDDGTEEELGPGDVAMIPPGHKTWVVGNEPVVRIGFTGLKEYAKS